MDLILVLIFSLLLVPAVEFAALEPLRIVLGLVFLLFFPGYALMAALLPRKGKLGALERAALSFALSIATVPLILFILNYTPWGLRLYPILFSAMLLVFAFSGLALYRRYRLPQEERFEPRLSIAPPWRKAENKLNRALLVALPLFVLGSMGLMAFVLVAPRPGERFTQFYVLGSGGTIGDYPLSLAPGEEARVTLGIVNNEYQEMDYTVEVLLEGERIEQIGPIPLGHAQEWRKEVAFLPRKVGEKQKVEFLLYRGEEKEPYDTLYLYIDVKI